MRLLIIINKFSILTLTLLTAFLVSDCLSQSKPEKETKKGMIIYSQISDSDIPWNVFAKSVDGREIYLLELGKGDSTTLIFGGFHGNETLGIELVFRFAQYLYKENQSPLKSKVIIIPVLNPDGLVNAKRQNANDVDINRNFPTANWSKEYDLKRNFPGLSPASEPETKAVINLLEKYKPQRIITVHTPLEMVNYDGPALEIAEAMAKFNNYPVHSDIGYPTPGSFGTYAGIERKIPTITLELPITEFDEIWQKNKESLLAAIGQ
jgi:murein peptide amidase A